MLNILKSNKFVTLITFLLCFFWLIIEIKSIPHVKYLTIGDSQRDTAIVLNIANGNILGDPAYAGEHPYYPFLTQSIYALIYKITNIPPITLYVNYGIITTIISLLLLIFSVWNLYRSMPLLLYLLTSLLFVFPLTSDSLRNSTTALTLSGGMMFVPLMWFVQAVKYNRKIDWIIAGFGIALIIYTHLAAAICICITLIIYQLITRFHWINFTLMCFAALIFSAPYSFPILFIYRLRILNPDALHLGMFENPSTVLDYLFYGRGILKWIDSFFVFVGLVVALKRRKEIDILILILFISTAVYTWLNLFEIRGVIPKVIPIIALNDFEILNHYFAAFLFAYGVYFILKKISVFFSNHKNIIFNLSSLILVIILLSISLPNYFQEINYYYQRNVNENKFLLDYYKEDEWRHAVDWINNNTKISDVILAPISRSHSYIQGHTGRKILVTLQPFSNPYVNRNERWEAMELLYGTTDIGLFLNLAKFYQIKYIVISAADDDFYPDGTKKYNDRTVFTPVFEYNTISIYQIKY